MPNMLNCFPKHGSQTLVRVFWGGLFSTFGGQIKSGNSPSAHLLFIALYLFDPNPPESVLGTELTGAWPVNHAVVLGYTTARPRALVLSGHLCFCKPLMRKVNAEIPA